MQQMIRRMMAFVLTLCICVSLFPVSVFAEGEEPLQPAEVQTEQETVPATEAERPEEADQAPESGNEAEEETRAALTRLEITALPEKLWYQVGDELDLTGIELVAWAEDGTSTLINLEEIQVAAGGTENSGANTVVLAYGELTAEFTIIVHKVYLHTNQVLDAASYPESTHNYSNSMDKRYPFAYPGAASLTLGFSARTRVEAKYDFIDLYDGAGVQLGQYSGTELAGKTITVPGDRFEIRLTSDSSQSYYGFSFSSITAEIRQVEHESSDAGQYHTYSCFDDGYPVYTCWVCART